MAILQEEMVQMSSQTFEKKIDSNAQQMMMGILQRYQYSMPQKSAVREIASNAVDALNEREVARSILTGKSKVEDHYMQRSDGIFSDSVFNPDYYDIKYLSNLNEVHIIYQNNGNTSRDELIIRDYGVGLWGKRLRGYFDLGFSTKRNARFALGKFGIGAKSALSTGVPYFTVRTRYNGMTTAFNVYDNNVEPVTPEFDMDRGIVHDHFIMDGFYDAQGNPAPRKIYFERTSEMNGVDIILQVKKHHKVQYIDAVRSQLMYFPEIRFKEITEDGKVIDHPVQAQVLYEDDAMVISNNTFHNKPHLLIDKINYGDINFTELELNERKGNVGIKVRSEDVTVNPSRETVIWDDTTKESILRAFNAVVASASKRLEKELTEGDLLSWYRSCAAMAYGYRGADGVITAMANIVDFTKIKPAFRGFPELTWRFPISGFMRFRKIKVTYGSKGSKRVMKLDRDSIIYQYEIFSSNLPIVRRFEGEDSIARKNKYIASKLYPQGYVEVVIPLRNPEKKEEFVFNYSNELLFDAVWAVTKNKDISQRDFGKNRENYKDDIETAFRVANYLADAFSSHESLVDYSSIVVPSEFSVSENEEEEDVVEDETKPVGPVIPVETPEERRKKLGTTLVHTLFKAYGGVRKVDLSDGTSTSVNANFTTTKLEIVPVDVDSWDEDEIYFANKDSEELMHLAGIICHPNPRVVDTMDNDSKKRVMDKYFQHVKFDNWGPLAGREHLLPEMPYFTASDIKLVMVSMDNTKYYTDFKHIRQFFMDIKDQKLVMSNQLVRWNTARLMRKHMYKLWFLQNFNLNDELRNKYLQLRAYADTYYSEVARDTYGFRGEHVDQLKEYLDNVGHFQLFVANNPNDAEGIAMMAKQLLNPAEGETVVDARAIDTTIYSQFIELLDYAEPVHVLLNAINNLTGGTNRESRVLTQELEQELRLYIQSKGAEVLLTYKTTQ